MAYEWKNNLACKATYVILEDLLDQIDKVQAPQDEAGDYKIEYLTSYPDDASNKIKEKWAKQISAKFIQYTLKLYDVKKERSTDSLHQWQKETWPVFKDGDKTLSDLAEVLDKYCKFSDE